MNTPTHEEISHRAHQLWLEHGRPDGRDEEDWLAAEGQLRAKSAAHEAKAAEATRGGHAAPPSATVPAVTAAANHIDPSPAEVKSTRAAVQKHDARAAQVPHHTGPVGKPVESGKPHWKQPHSS